jgi:hypothetical protein
MVGHYSAGNFVITAGSGGIVEITDPTVPNGGRVEPPSSETFPRQGIDLPNIAFGVQTTLAYAANATCTGGTLTLGDGRHTAAIADRAHQARALALFAQAFDNEEIADIAGAAPHPAVKAAGARTVALAQEDAYETPIGYAGRLDVEINEAVFEEADVLEARVGFDDEPVLGRRFVGMICGHAQQYNARRRRWSRTLRRDRGA